MASEEDVARIASAIVAAASARRAAAPNPNVGAIVVRADGREFTGVTQPPGGAHAEIEAMRAAGPDLVGATLYTTLEPCSHVGRTGPCADAIIDAGIGRVVVGLVDPDPQVAGTGIARLRAAHIDVETGVGAADVSRQLRSYVHHRRTGRPFVTLKLAATLDGRTAAPDGSSQWITGEVARADVHRLRADSDGILVGAGTVRADDPSLTVRHVEGPDPRRYVLGHARVGARVHPCTEVGGELEDVLASIGADGVLDLLVEGGARVAGAFHRGGHVDRYVLYVAPALMGGADGAPLFDGAGSPDMAGMFRGHIVDVRPVGDDLRVEMLPGGVLDAENRR